MNHTLVQRKWKKAGSIKGKRVNAMPGQRGGSILIDEGEGRGGALLP